MAATQTVSKPRVLEPRLLLDRVSWKSYQSLLEDYASSSSPRFTYDQGLLEIMTPLPDHEGYARFIEFILAAVAAQLGVEIYDLGAATFRRDDLQQGFEADASFYLHSPPSIDRRKPVDLQVNRPPDLVLEIDITHPSLDKLSIYAQFGVPEVWRYDGENLHMLVLDGDTYSPKPRSRLLPEVVADALSDLLRGGEDLGMLGWQQKARDYAQGLPGPPDA